MHYFANETGNIFKSGDCGAEHLFISDCPYYAPWATLRAKDIVLNEMDKKPLSLEASGGNKG